MSQDKPIIKIGGWSNGVDGVAEPPTAKKASGWAQEKPPYQYHNWLQYVVALWVDYLYDLNFKTTATFNLDFNNDVATFTNSGTSVVSSYNESGAINANCVNGSVKSSKFLTVKNCEDFDFLSLSNSSFTDQKITGIALKRSSGLTIGSSTDKEVSGIEIKDSSNGTIGSETKYISNIKVNNSDGFTITGSDIEVENSSAIVVNGDKIGIKNSNGVTVNAGVTRSNIEGVDDFTETRSDTKTVNNHRVLGSKIVKKVAASTPVGKVGEADQKLFGNRHLSNQADLYWRCEGGDPLWRDANTGLNPISSGTQTSSRTLFSNGVVVDPDATVIFPIQSTGSFDINQDNVLSFWINVLKVDSTNIHVCKFCSSDTFATGEYGWAIVRNSVGEYIATNHDSSEIVALGNLPDLVEVNISVVWDNSVDSFMFFVDGEYKGLITLASSSLGTGNIELQVGRYSAGLDAVGIIATSDVSFWFNKIFSEATIKKLYCGGVSLTADAALFTNAKISTVHLIDTANRPYEEPKVITEDGDEFVYLEFPKYMKGRLHDVDTNIEVFTEKYILE